MIELKTYSLKKKRGVDDLISEYAFHGNSQGDETQTNSIEAYKASQGWLSFGFTCELTDEAIQKEVAIRKEQNEKYIQELKDSGRYLEEYEISISLAPNPIFDEPPSNKYPELRPMESYKFLLIDLNNNNHDVTK